MISVRVKPDREQRADIMDTLLSPRSNVLGAIVALTLRYRQDGRLPLYKMRDHRSGGKYICLNTTTVFLCGHILTSLVFGLYVLL